jgi:hypothetical protein
MILSFVCTLPFGAAAIAAPIVAKATADVTQLAEAAARKGTRNYRSDDAATATPSDSAADKDGLSKSEKLSQCMDTWDKGTHITKDKWREICQRQLNEF